MKIEKELKDQIKSNRLHTLQQRYYDLYLDLISLEAVGNTARAEEIKNEMEKIKKVYQVVEEVKTEE